MAFWHHHNKKLLKAVISTGNYLNSAITPATRSRSLMSKHGIYCLPIENEHENCDKFAIRSFQLTLEPMTHNSTVQVPYSWCHHRCKSLIKSTNYVWICIIDKDVSIWDQNINWCQRLWFTNLQFRCKFSYVSIERKEIVSPTGLHPNIPAVGKSIGEWSGKGDWKENQEGSKGDWICWSSRGLRSEVVLITLSDLRNGIISDICEQMGEKRIQKNIHRYPSSRLRTGDSGLVTRRNKCWFRSLLKVSINQIKI